MLNDTQFATLLLTWVAACTVACVWNAVSKLGSKNCVMTLEHWIALVVACHVTIALKHMWWQIWQRFLHLCHSMPKQDTKGSNHQTHGREAGARPVAQFQMFSAPTKERSKITSCKMIWLVTLVSWLHCSRFSRLMGKTYRHNEL